MSTLDLNIIDIFHGNTPVLKVMKGDSLKWPLLPYDSEVEYIQSDGVAYINTGIPIRSRNLEIIMDVQWVGDTSSQFETFLGFMGSSSSPRSGIHKYQGNWMYGTNVTKSTGVAVDGSRHSIRLVGTASNNSEVFYLDGTQVATATTSSTGLADNLLPLYVFCRMRPNSFDNPAEARIYGLKITTQYGGTGQKIYEFKPVRIGQVGYLYEVESETLFGNANSSGAFIIGNDK